MFFKLLNKRTILSRRTFMYLLTVFQKNPSQGWGRLPEKPIFYKGKVQKKQKKRNKC